MDFSELESLKVIQLGLGNSRVSALIPLIM